MGSCIDNLPRNHLDRTELAFANNLHKMEDCNDHYNTHYPEGK